jgi:hypothetical protein
MPEAGPILARCRDRGAFGKDSASIAGETGLRIGSEEVDPDLVLQSEALMKTKLREPHRDAAARSPQRVRRSAFAGPA